MGQTISINELIRKRVITLDANLISSTSKSIVTSGPYYVSNTDDVLFFNSAIAITVHLPTGAISNGRLKLCNIGTGNVIVNANGSELIFGVSFETLYPGEVFDIDFNLINEWW